MIAFLYAPLKQTLIGNDFLATGRKRENERKEREDQEREKKQFCSALTLLRLFLSLSFWLTSFSTTFFLLLSPFLAQYQPSSPKQERPAEFVVQGTFMDFSSSFPPFHLCVRVGLFFPIALQYYFPLFYLVFLTSIERKQDRVRSRSPLPFFR